MKRNWNDRTLEREVRVGNVRAISRLITLLESGNPDAQAMVDRFGSPQESAEVIGITGYPGAGKSTLIDQLITVYRSQGKKVGALVIDTSSPFTGGALLGDRIRMQDHSMDEQVYIRSMATRGHRGGLARTTRQALRVLEVAGFEVVLIETIGVGQEEGEITQLAPKVVVVVAPGLGDEVQAMKAGILEVAHLVVVNKADHPYANATIHALQEWVPMVLPTVALKGEGIQQVVEALGARSEVMTGESPLFV